MSESDEDTKMPDFVQFRNKIIDIIKSELGVTTGAYEVGIAHIVALQIINQKIDYVALGEKIRDEMDCEALGIMSIFYEIVGGKHNVY